MALIKPFRVQEFIRLSSTTFLLTNSYSKHLSYGTSADMKTLVSNTEPQRTSFGMSWQGCKNTLKYPKNDTNSLWENATGCYLPSVADMNFFVRRCVLWTPLWKLRVFKRHDYCSVLFQISQAHNRSLLQEEGICLLTRVMYIFSQWSVDIHKHIHHWILK